MSMTTPAADMSDAELWLRITQLPRASKIVDYPKKDPITDEPLGQVLIQVLTQQEQMEASIAAETYARKWLKDSPNSSAGYENVYNNASAVEVIYRACRRPDAPLRPMFPSPALIKQRMTADEVGVLMQSYLQVQYDLGPIAAHMSTEEYEAWVSRLARGGESFPLASLSWEARTDLTMRMASQLHSLLTDTSSAGSPQDEPSQEPDAEA